MSKYEDKTVEELQDDLRDRDLKVSGTKDELIARLEEADAGQSKTEKVLEEPESVAEEANPNPEDTEQADPPAALKDFDDETDNPTQQQVVQQQGWTVQQGSWRKGAGKDA